MAPAVPCPGPSRSQPHLLVTQPPLRTSHAIVSPAADILARQLPATVTVTAVPVTPPPRPPSDDSSSTLSGGAIAGIVIGSVVGILLLLWIIRSCFDLGAPPQERESMYHYVKPERQHRHRSRHRSRPRRYSYASEVSIPPGVVLPEGGRTRRHRRMVYGESGKGRRYRRNG
ncbi:hypothetical protein E4U55_006700 [Claviceps digitariae]|nr:hypothetical protein E4U55_006700 [Claviceps digitariae]